MDVLNLLKQKHINTNRYYSVLHKIDYQIKCIGGLQEKHEDFELQLITNPKRIEKLKSLWRAEKKLQKRSDTLVKQLRIAAMNGDTDAIRAGFKLYHCNMPMCRCNMVINDMIYLEGKLDEN